MSPLSFAKIIYASEHPTRGGAYTSVKELFFNPSDATFFCCSGCETNERRDENSAPSVAAFTPIPVPTLRTNIHIPTAVKRNTGNFFGSFFVLLCSIAVHI